MGGGVDACDSTRDEVALRADRSGRLNFACPTKYMLEGTNDEHVVQWRLLWADRRYQDGSIPEEEATSFPKLSCSRICEPCLEKHVSVLVTGKARP
ncbi:Imm72 family immunity protein [Burkholderia gladioli]|uniref:Imm72 family immunity protein n=1 Tax=Burkholderia gladioli TaxID=28095 RepID=UPI00163DFDA6